MDVLFAIRSDYRERIGGDTFQFLFTKEYLENYYDVNIIVIKSPEEIEQFSHIEIVHVFNMQDRSWASTFLQKAKECGKKTVLSTIYWDLSHANYIAKIARLTSNLSIWSLLKEQRFVFSWIADLLKGRGVGGRRTMAGYRDLLMNVDMILPNSVEEAEIVKKTFGDYGYQVRSVPNAISPVVDRNNAKFMHGKYENCIMEVGRIEPVKNQMAVVKACMDNNIPIVFIGRIGDQRYYKELRKLADRRGNVYFLGELPQKEIADYYKTAKVHVLPSFRESPGLVTLEAMYYGCNVVVANECYCPIKYYQFDKYAYICEPYSVKSIRNAVLQAYHDEKKTYNEELFQFISYENVAKTTYEAYKAVMNQA